MADIVACDIHPLNNLRVLQALAELGQPMGSGGSGRVGEGWIAQGFDALEPMIVRHGRGCAFADGPGLADCCIAPQIVSAGRFDVDHGALAEPFAALGARYDRRPSVRRRPPADQAERRDSAPESAVVAPYFRLVLKSPGRAFIRCSASLRAPAA